jgi:cephalosporin-C deacetylase
MSTSGDWRQVRPGLTRAADFDAFWRDTLQNLDNINLDPQILTTETRNSQTRLDWLQYRSLDDALINAYLIQWLDAKPRPLLVYTHGYGGQCNVMWRWARAGLNVFGFDIRGFGRSARAVNPLSEHGYILTGIHSPFQSILRGAVCDFLQGVRLSSNQLSGKVSSVVFFGKSFGGALAAIAAALRREADFLACGVPSLCWAQGRRELTKAGSGAEINRYLARYPQHEPQVMATLSYFDTMNFAVGIRCNTLVGVGVRDDIVPSPTVYAFINHLECRKRVREFPYSHSDQPEERRWLEFDKEWLEMATSGEYKNI